MLKRIGWLLAAVLLVGCAAPTRLTNVWRDEAVTPTPARHLVVVGFGDDGAGRRIFEEEFVRVLGAAGVAATAGYTAGAGSDPAKAREAAARVGADTVLAIRLVNVEQRVNVYPGHLMVAPGVTYRRHLQHWDTYTSSAVIMSSPPSAYNYTVMKLETNLWRGDRLHWSAASETFADDDAHRMAAEFAGVIVAALRSQGLL